MPYSKAHKQNSRERILNSAIELFSRHGFDQVSIDDLMTHASLTRGAFYAHFSSKSDVYFHAITAAAINAFANNDYHQTDTGAAWLRRFVGVYLSVEHVEQKGSPCPLAFMVSDVASKDPKVRQAYTKVFAGFADILNEHMAIESQSKSPTVNLSLAISAMMIGSVAIGRAIADNGLRRQLLQASSEITKQLLGIA